MIIKNINELRFDRKGRIWLPAEERKQLGGPKAKVVIRRKGNELIFYSAKEWSRFTNRILKGLRGLLLRKVNRDLFGTNTIQERIDNQGRIAISESLRERRKLEPGSKKSQS